MALIQIEHLSFSYPSSYDPIFEDVSLRLDTSWKLGFIGRNGRGKTTFFKLLMGRYEYAGSIRAPVAFDYFPYPVPDPGRPTRAVLEGVCPGAESWQLERELSLLGVRPDALDRPFASLSNGEQTKVLLAALFLNEGHFLLIDEPTNHLDAKARAMVSAYLQKKQGFILVSHDRRFLDGCVDHILSLNRAGIEGPERELFLLVCQLPAAAGPGRSPGPAPAQGHQAAGAVGPAHRPLVRPGGGQQKGRRRQGLCGPQGRQDDEAGQDHRGPPAKGHRGKIRPAEKRRDRRGPAGHSPAALRRPPGPVPGRGDPVRRADGLRAPHLCRSGRGAGGPGRRQRQPANPACSSCSAARTSPTPARCAAPPGWWSRMPPRTPPALRGT